MHNIKIVLTKKLEEQQRDFCPFKIEIGYNWQQFISVSEVRNAPN